MLKIILSKKGIKVYLGKRRWMCSDRRRWCLAVFHLMVIGEMLLYFVTYTAAEMGPGSVPVSKDRGRDQDLNLNDMLRTWCKYSQIRSCFACLFHFKNAPTNLFNSCWFFFYDLIVFTMSKYANWLVGLGLMTGILCKAFWFYIFLGVWLPTWLDSLCCLMQLQNRTFLCLAESGATTERRLCFSQD